MLISHKHKFIFLKPGKVAGTSTEIYFEKYCYSSIDQWSQPDGDICDMYDGESGIVGERSPNTTSKWTNHMNAREIKNKIGKEIWDTYYKFGPIRNPFSRLVSYYKFFSYNNKMNFSEFCSLPTSRQGGLLYYFYDLDKEKYDAFIKMENTNNDIQKVCNNLNLSEVDTLEKRKMRSDNKHYTEYYDDETRDIVAEKYAKDIEYFGYKFGE